MNAKLSRNLTRFLVVTIFTSCLAVAPKLSRADNSRRAIQGLIVGGAAAIMLRELEKSKRRSSRPLAGVQRSKPNGPVSLQALLRGADADKKYTVEMQLAVTAAGYNIGEIDAIWGEKTRAAARAIQSQLGNPQTGRLSVAELQTIKGQLSIAVSPLAEQYGAGWDLEPGETDEAYTRRMQTALLGGGFPIGDIDGKWGDIARSATRTFQAQVGTPRTGRLTRAELAMLEGGDRPTAKTALLQSDNNDAAPKGAMVTLQSQILEPPQPGTIAGAWRGTLTCAAKDKQGDAFFEVTGPSNRRYQAFLRFFPKDHLKDGFLALSLIGEFDDAAGLYRFAVANRQAGGGHLPDLTGFELILDPTTNELKSKSLVGPCSNMVLAHDTSITARKSPSVSSTTAGGSYFSASDTISRCDALAAWTSRFNREFPGEPDPMKDVKKAALLFGDEDFVPVFGSSYDRFDGAETFRNSPFAECKIDPLLVQKLKPVQGISQAFRSRNGSGRFSPESISFIVYTQREKRLSLNQLLSIAPTDTDETIFNRLEVLRSDISEDAFLFWPSETNRLRTVIADHVLNVSRAIADREMATLRTITEPTMQIIAIKTAMTPGGWFTRLPDKDRTPLEQELKDRQTAAVQAILSPFNQSFVGLPRSFDGIAESENLLNVHEAALRAVDELSRSKLISTVTEWKSSVLTELISHETAPLKALPVGPEGLAALEQWKSHFAAKFAKHEGHSAFATVMTDAAALRLKILRDGVDHFEQRLKALAGNGKLTQNEIEPVLDTYLPSPLDLKSPVSLEYRLVAAGFK